MVQIVLIRPGSTDYDEQGRIQGTLDIPLNERGDREVRQTIEGIRTLGITAVYSGPGQSVYQTATAIATATDAKLKVLDTLANIDHGLWQGMLVDDVKRKQPKVYRQWQEQPEIICPPEGEMLSAVQERIQTALAKIVKKHKDGVVALVVPEPLASVIHCYLSRSEIGDLWRSATDCVKWEVIQLEPQTVAQIQS